MRLRGLRRWNAGLSILHLAQALTLLALAGSFSLPLSLDRPFPRALATKLP